MISLDKVQISFGGFDLLKDASFLVRQDDRIGLVGKNGAGKTTLLKLISGVLEPSSGSINIPKGTTVGYLPQEMKLTDRNSLLGETMLAFEELLSIEKQISGLNSDISNAIDFESDEYLNKLNLLSELNERFTILGGDSFQADMEQTLLGLGFERSDFNRSTAEFSGGWRMRVELAKLLLKKPDVILLDEPTNHLDIESIQWLEDFLKSYKGSVVLVSHDKAFLNAVCNRTLEISLGKITDQNMNYSAFMEWKQEQREIQLSAYRNQQKMIEDTEKFIERFRYKATKAVQVQSRIRQLERLDRIEIEEEDNAALKIKFPPPPRSGKVVLEAKNVTKKYGDHLVLSGIDLQVESGDKIAFVGRNGEGKTTLVKIILQQLDFSGSLKVGHNVKVGYFAQNQARLLDGELTVFDTIDEIATGDVRTKIRDILGAFLFSGEDADKKVKVLSGGEKSRLAMIRLMLEPVNLLVLDEPTNHLDMRSKEILKDALIQFPGTVIVVSHDREFLDGMVDCVYEFRNKKIKQHLGGIYAFLQKKKMDSLKELEMPSGASGVSANEKSKQGSQAQGLSFEERKEVNRSISKAEKTIAEIEKSIELLESEIAGMDEQLSKPEKVDDVDIYERYEIKKKELAKTMEQWENAHEELENWKNKKDW
ncbi:ATP-binding cassette, subfamily F, member 3 [Mariniphaga anaerophila]|uniref:Probable ATP-binding protein YbiT n=1 Tax=Mariniphaga anaerophila TaxID=1484053 RepID=A0A1M5A4Q0_9BACT|nr:ABC-F family ATP-binding cassette domain-containing protein [Mariniphaga anaerophila]SHF25289.1 ATP-binding cassette, subfamily F, member 3 [Mariniphaga anaerophila]